jgi:uncharacterized protein with FMN-binding domain
MRDTTHGDDRRGGRSVPGRRLRLATLALGTAGGLVAVFHYDAMLSSGSTGADSVGAQMVPAAQASDGMPSASSTGQASTSGMGAITGARAGTGRGGRTGASPSVSGMSGTHRSSGMGATAGSGAMAAAPAVARTVLGDATDTQWGVVQVKLTVRGGKIVSAGTVQSPHSTDHSLEINANALPILNRETVTAQSAHIDAVSGATVTSGGYLTSLQSAVDRAHLA